MFKTSLAGAIAGIVLAGSLGLGGCRAVHHLHITHEAVHLHHWKNGRYAYQDTNGGWWWIMYPDGTARMDGGLISQGSWVRGGAPSAGDLAESDVVDAVISVADGGAPMTEAQASAAEAESGGGMSESSAGPSESSPSVDSSASSSSSSSSSSSDSGGGGGDGGGSSGE
jgi:hypothetical protein